MPAELSIDLKKLMQNAESLALRCANNGMNITAVTKAYCADPTIVTALSNTPITFLGDSRLENIARYPETEKKKMLLRISDISESDDVVSLCDVSLQSEMLTVERIATAAEKQKRKHAIVLMVDIGDLREGVYYKNFPKLLETARLCLSHPWLELCGIGTNLTCYGGIIPTREKLSLLCDIAARLRNDTGAPLLMISGGNSSTLHLLEQDAIPSAISHLRLGEAIIRGVETAYGKDLSWLHQNAVILSAPIIEIQDKPSMPEGEIGVNAFGEKMVFADRGYRRRAILAIGRQDTDHTGLTCLDEGVEILGASSDHLLLDIGDAKKPWKLGDSVHFSLSYGSILGCFNSRYIRKKYI